MLLQCKPGKHPSLKLEIGLLKIKGSNTAEERGSKLRQLLVVSATLMLNIKKIHIHTLIWHQITQFLWRKLTTFHIMKASQSLPLVCLLYLSGLDWHFERLNPTPHVFYSAFPSVFLYWRKEGISVMLQTALLLLVPVFPSNLLFRAALEEPMPGHLFSIANTWMIILLVCYMHSGLEPPLSLSFQSQGTKVTCH